MKSEMINMDELTETRRQAITKSIRTIDVEELRKIGDRLFPTVENPWRDTFFGFMTENTGATFYHGTTDDGIQVIYCPAKDKGMWFKPGVGMGPMQAKGRGIVKQIVEGR